MDPHLHANGIHFSQPITVHVITMIDVRRCTYAISCAL